MQKDRAERHDFWQRLSLFFSPFLLKKEKEEKENEVAKIVFKSHAFLLDHAKGPEKKGSPVAKIAKPFFNAF